MKETNVILVNGDRFNLVGDTVTCPCCMNGAMTLKEDNGDSLVFECVKCRTTLTVPYVSLKEGD